VHSLSTTFPAPKIGVFCSHESPHTAFPSQSRIIILFRAYLPSHRPPAEFIPPVQEPYQYIIFRASEVKDLAVDEPTPRRSVHDDPAVLGVRLFVIFFSN
jgi:hypothetical protein